MPQNYFQERALANKAQQDALVRMAREADLRRQDVTLANDLKRKFAVDNELGAQRNLAIATGRGPQFTPDSIGPDGSFIKGVSRDPLVHAGMLQSQALSAPDMQNANKFQSALGASPLALSLGQTGAEADIATNQKIKEESDLAKAIASKKSADAAAAAFNADEVAKQRERELARIKAEAAVPLAPDEVISGQDKLISGNVKDATANDLERDLLPEKAQLQRATVLGDLAVSPFANDARLTTAKNAAELERKFSDLISRINDSALVQHKIGVRPASFLDQWAEGGPKVVQSSLIDEGPTRTSAQPPPPPAADPRNFKTGKGTSKGKPQVDEIDPSNIVINR